jgi:predicted nuclease with RNAse H fold
MKELMVAMQSSLLGVDVGFSKARKTTGLAWCVNGRIGVALAGTNWLSRSAELPTGILFDMVAVDAPVVPSGPSQDGARGCESVLSRDAFSRRCKPGMSHFGRGLALRQSGSDAARQFGEVCAELVEAFPNAALAVLLDQAVFDEPALHNRAKSDRYYEAAARGALEKMLDALGWVSDEGVKRVLQERHHDLRAALVCLMVAGFAAARTATAVGDPAGGWIVLPPEELWASWAREALTRAVECTRHQFPDVSARCWLPADPASSSLQASPQQGSIAHPQHPVPAHAVP